MHPYSLKSHSHRNELFVYASRVIRCQPVHCQMISCIRLHLPVLLAQVKVKVNVKGQELAIVLLA